MRSFLLTLLLLFSTIHTSAQNAPQPSVPEEITLENFSIKIREGWVLVDFYATWCGSCTIFEPIFVKTAQDMHANIAFYKVDVDMAWDLLEQYEIQSIPTLIFFKDGGEVSRHEGEMTEESLKEFISANLT